MADAVSHEKFGSGIISAIESSELVEVYWLAYVGPPWRRPRVRAEELTHDWALQAEYADFWEHASDNEWEPLGEV